MVNLLRKILSLFVFLLLCGFVSAQEKTKELSLDSYLDKILNEVLKRRQLNQTGQNLNTNLNQNQFQAQLDKKNKEEEKKKKSAEMQKMFGTLSQLLGSVGFGGAVNNLPNNLNSNVMPDIFPGSNQSTFPGSTQPVQNSQAAAYYPANTLQRYLGDSGANISQQIGLRLVGSSPNGKIPTNTSIGNLPGGSGQCLIYGDSLCVGMSAHGIISGCKVVHFGGNLGDRCEGPKFEGDISPNGGRLWSHFKDDVRSRIQNENTKIIVWQLMTNGDRIDGQLNDPKPGGFALILAGLAKQNNKILLLPVYGLGGIGTQTLSDKASKRAKEKYPNNVVLIDYAGLNCQRDKDMIHFGTCYKKMFNKLQQTIDSTLRKSKDQLRDVPSS